MFIFELILIILGVAAIFIGLALKRGHAKAKAAHDEKFPNGSPRYGDEAPSPIAWRVTGLVGAALAATGVLLAVFSSFYTQGPGESILQKDITGNVVGSTVGTGVHWKAPWVDTTVYNIRQQQIKFVGNNGNSDNAGGTADGAQVTVQDADGVTSNIDVALRYSIRPDSVIDIYKQFGSEDNFKQSFIEQDIRSAVRDAPNQFHTLALLTDRVSVTNAIKSDLEARWAKFGVTIDSVSLQEIRAPKSVVQSYAEAQQAQISVQKEQAKLDAAKISAQQKVVQAEADAKANGLLTASLTPQVLQQHYIDALKAGTVYVVPQGSTPFIGTK